MRLALLLYDTMFSTGLSVHQTMTPKKWKEGMDKWSLGYFKFF
jgi:hypothetical protein